MRKKGRISRNCFIYDSYFRKKKGGEMIGIDENLPEMWEGILWRLSVGYRQRLSDTYRNMRTRI